VLNNTKNKSSKIIKRVIGLPGDIINIWEDSILVLTNKIEIKYHFNQNKKIFLINNLNRKLVLINQLNKETNQNIIVNLEPLVVLCKKDQYFVLGDNYYNSYDSRYFGPISIEQIIGVFQYKLNKNSEL